MKKHKIIAIVALISSLELLSAVQPKKIVEPLSQSFVAAGEISGAALSGLGEIFFGNTVSAYERENIIDEHENFVRTRDAYPASLAVVQKHAEAIKVTAQEKGVPEDVAIGVALLENGGSETAKSPAGALGIYQLMPGTAKSLGLKVGKNVDERKNPSKSIEAGITYLRSNYERFGDWGLATWAYHAGEGNVTKALQIYAQNNNGITLPGVNNPGPLKDYVLKESITIHKLLSDPAVRKFTKRLNDDSAGYPYKVAATANLFNESK